MKNRNFYLNPYTPFGKLHNKGVTFILEKIEMHKKTPVEPEHIVIYAAEFMVAIENGFTNLDIAYDYTMNSSYRFYYKHIVETIKSLEDEDIFKKDSVEGINKYFIEDILGIQDYDETALKILINFEERIIDCNEKEINKDLLLIMIAIGKASIEYFAGPDYKGRKSIGGTAKDELSPLARFPWKNDVEGAYKGFASGGIGGLFMGNPLMGALMGALATSIADSTWAIVKERWLGRHFK